MIWIAVVNDVDVGVIRFDRIADSQEAEVSLYLAPDEMGKGLGSLLLSAGEREIVQHWQGIKRIVAQVLPENQASQRLFTQAAYQQTVQRFYKQVSS